MEQHNYRVFGAFDLRGFRKRLGLRLEGPSSDKQERQTKEVCGPSSVWAWSDDAAALSRPKSSTSEITSQTAGRNKNLQHSLDSRNSLGRLLFDKLRLHCVRS